MTKAHPATQNLPLRQQLKEENGALRNNTTAEDVTTPNACKQTVPFVLSRICLHEDTSSINNRVTSETILI